jgi:transcriptional regulator of arginine metabolism
MDRPRAESRASGGGRAARRARQQAIRELVAREGIGSQQQLAELLAGRGFEVTQATVSRDIAELGLVKVVRGDRHVYASPAELVGPPEPDDRLLRRVVADFPIEVRRSGLILLLISAPGSAQVISEAIDRSGLEQAGTLAGENTVLVLFEDEAGLERWRERWERLQAQVRAEAE